MTRSRLLAPTAAIFLVVVLARLIAAALVPVVQDEAYYLEWSRALDWGYFDHPPGVAWISITSWLSPSSAFAGRLGAVIAATLAFPFAVGLFRRAGLTDRATFVAALLLVNFNLCGLVFGVLTTPDALFVPAWCAALHEAAAALEGSRRRWLTAGLAAGIGLLGKYVMVLIGPVFLWGLLAGDRRGLRTPWPYLGGLVALLIFSPHLAWNAANDWVPVRLQLQHGFEGGHEPPFERATDLPAPERPAPDGPEVRLGSRFGASLEHPRPEEKPAWKAFLQRTSEYAAAVLAVWGAFLVLLVHWAWLRLRGGRPPPSPLRERVRPLLVAAAVVPVVFFGIASLFSNVEANWPAVYTVGASALLAGFAASRPRRTVVLAACNLALFLAVVLHAHNPVLARGRDRILKETHGWPELAAHVARLEGPVLTDREQRTSMIRFYAPGIRVAQWPGITQPSEFVRRPEWNYYRLADLEEHGGFWLVTGWPLPPRLPGFEPVEMTELRDCLEEGLVVTEAAEARPGESPCPETTVHVWYLVRYRTQAATPGPPSD